MSPAPAPTNIFSDATPTFDWDNYLKSRPSYTGSVLYDRLFSYHDAHSGAYNTAYDIGCGPGQVASALAAKFARVHGSDPNTHAISAARKRLLQQQQQQQQQQPPPHASSNNNNNNNISLTFEVNSAEAIVSGPQAQTRIGSADLVTVAECIPLMADTRAAMAAFAQLLRPGGTLAIWFYGGPIFTRPQCASEESADVRGVQALFAEIMSRSYDQFRPLEGSVLEQPCTMINSWLDNVAFDPVLFGDVERVKWNTDKELNFVRKERMGFDVQYVNLIGPGEVVEDVGVDRRCLLTEGVDVGWVKGFVDSSIAREKDWITAEVREMFGELEGKMKGRVWNVSWPVVLLLAARTKT